MLTDSDALFNVIIRNSHTTEKRLMIEINDYNEKIIAYVIWIRGKDNLSDVMTKLTSTKN